MAHTPKDYQPVRDAHQQALDALNSHIDQSSRDVGTSDREPTRPEGVYRQVESWPMEATMPAQNRAAAQMNDRNQEHQAALHALNQHIERAESGQKPEQTPDRNNEVTLEPTPDIER